MATVKAFRAKKTKKPYKKKGYTECQKKIAAVIVQDFSINATVENLRNDHEWRKYVCNCEGVSVHYNFVVGKDISNYNGRDNPAKGADYTYTGKNGKTITIKGRNIRVGTSTAPSKCADVIITVPAHRRPQSGKQILYLRINGS